MRGTSLARRSRERLLAALVALGFAFGPGLPSLSAQSAVGGDWARWRGPEGAGVAAPGRLPTTWSPDAPNVRWRTRVPGKGISSPIVVGERVFITTAFEAEESRFLLDAAGLCLALCAGLVCLARGRDGVRSALEPLRRRRAPRSSACPR